MDSLYVATRKGLFTFARAGDGWQVTDLAFRGDPVVQALFDPRAGGSQFPGLGGFTCGTDHIQALRLHLLDHLEANPAVGAGHQNGHDSGGTCGYAGQADQQEKNNGFQHGETP